MRNKVMGMERLYIDDFDALANIMHEKALQRKTTYAVLFYDEAIELIRELMVYCDVDVNSIDIAAGDFNGYFKEYVVSLSSDMMLDVEPAWHGANEYVSEGYLWIGSADTIYIDGDASSSILKDVEGNVYELVFSDDEYDDEGIENAIDVTELFKGLLGNFVFIPVLLPNHDYLK